MEEWRVINGFPNYSVSNLGNLMNNKTGKFLKSCIKGGYLHISLTNGKIKKTLKVHRLVALTFLDNPEKKEQVNHKDGNKLNNSIENLEWCNNKENQIHKFKIGLGNNFTRKIIQYDLNMNKIKEFNSITEASKELNISKSNIQGVLINYRNTAGGFVFKYIEDNNIDFTKTISINKNIGRKVVQYDLKMNLINVYHSISDASRKTNIHKNNIRGVIINYRKTSEGFIWKYLEEK